MSGIRATFEGNRRRFFVSSRTVLLIRFDTGARLRADTTDLRIETKPKPNEVVRLNPTAKAFGLPSDVFRAAAAATNANLADAISRISLADDLSRFLDLQSLNSARTINTHRNADELTLKLAWKDAPFDARTIRAILLLHFEGTVPASAFATGQPGTGTAPTGYLVPATYSNLRFVGLADEVGDEHGTSGDYVTLKARDLTAVLIDAQLPPLTRKTIKAGTTLLEVVRNLLETLRGTAADFIRGPVLRGIDESELPKLSADRYPKLATTAASRNKAGNSGGEPMIIRHASKGGGDETYWDAITDLCVSHGLVPFIDRDVLVLQPPRTLYTGAPTVPGIPGELTFPTPYRRSIGDVAHRVRRMIWGGNVESLRFHRKLSRIKAPAVRVTSFDPNAKDAKKRLLEVYHPADYAKTATKVDPTGKGGTVEVHNVVVQGVTDLALLRAVAEATYEAMGRGELGVAFGTSDPASWSDHDSFDPNEDPDLLDIRAGDPIEMLVTPTQRRSGQVFSLTELGASVGRMLGVAEGGLPQYVSAIGFLVARGWRDEDARQLARVLASANLLNTFRVTSANVTIDGEGGDVQISIDARDYIRARADPSDSARSGGGVGTVTAGGVVT